MFPTIHVYVYAECLGDVTYKRRYMQIEVKLLTS